MANLDQVKQTQQNLTVSDSDGKKVIRILRLGKMGSQVNWFDFVEVPQGYVKICGSGVPKPKRSRKFAFVNGSLIDPSDDQIIDHAKYLMRNSGKDPADFEFVITDKDFRDENGRGIEY